MILSKSAANARERCIAADEKPFLIAEFGLNHNRDLAIAKRMVDAAKSAGIDAIKLQSYTTEYFINRQFENVHALYDIFAGLELDITFHTELRDYSVAAGLCFFSTPLTTDWVQKLVALEVPAFKIASGDANNWPLIAAMQATQKPLIASTGAASQTELQALIHNLEANSAGNFALLHCVSLYPTPEDMANISRMHCLRGLLSAPKSIPLGFSDHTEGTNAACAAVAAGAQIIEKHFTLDKSLPGPDQKMSFDPAQMQELRQAIDSAFAIRGAALTADCHPQELLGDYFGKRSLYNYAGEVRAMRPRHPSYPLP